MTKNEQNFDLNLGLWRFVLFRLFSRHTTSEDKLSSLPPNVTRTSVLPSHRHPAVIGAEHLPPPARCNFVKQNCQGRLSLLAVGASRGTKSSCPKSKIPGYNLALAHGAGTVLRFSYAEVSVNSPLIPSATQLCTWHGCKRRLHGRWTVGWVFLEG